MILTPGKVSLASWRAIARGEAFSLDPAAMPAVVASAAAVDAIVEKGDPVYGINTGFGKLASVRIAPDELGQLQRNIVLSHAAGVGAPMTRRERAADAGAEAREPRARRLRRAAADARVHAADAASATCSRWCRSKARSARRAISRRSRT